MAITAILATDTIMLPMVFLIINLEGMHFNVKVVTGHIVEEEMGVQTPSVLGDTIQEVPDKVDYILILKNMNSDWKSLV